MPNLLNSFGRTKTWIDNNGKVLFESSVPGTYSYTFPRKTKCGVACVGGGAGGFSARLGITVNKGSPSEMTLWSQMAYSGASGGYSYTEQVFQEGDVLTISVGSGGSAYQSGGQYGSIYESSPSISFNNVNGTASRVLLNSNLITFANPGTGGRWYLSNPANPNSATAAPSSAGRGSTSYGNNGAVATDSNVVSGGASVYNGYGKGGNASKAPYAVAGGNGYVKVFIKE